MQDVQEMFKENGTRPITRASINSRSQMRSKKDRKDWDDRFSIERMPEYNALKDRHWQAYVNIIKKKFKKTKRIQPQVEMAPGRIRRRKIKQPDEGSVERNGSRPTGSRPPKAGIGKNRNAITDEVMETLKEDLNRIWDEFRIPQYHKDVFSRSLQHLSTESAAAMIAKEIENIRKHKSPVQKVVLGVIAREKLLHEIENSNFREGDNLEEFVTLISNKLQSLRILSLNVVEWVMIWREQMLYAYYQSSTDHKNVPIIPFVWENENYLLKLKRDTEFLKDHSLSKWFNFADKNDPFLVIPSCSHSGVGVKGLKKVRKNLSKKAIGKEDNKYEVPLDNSIMQRIKASEVVLENELKGHADESSPQTTKTVESPPQKSDKKINLSDKKSPESKNDENMHPNHDSENAVNKRESLFDLRKKNKIVGKPASESESTPKVAPQKHHDPDMKSSPIKEAEIEDEENFDFEFLPTGTSESEAKQFLEKYYQKLDSGLSKSYAKPEELMKAWRQGNNTQWITLKNKWSRSSIDGLLIFSLDSHFNRVNILHLSTISRKGLNIAIEASMKFIWEKVNAKEWRIGIYHFEGEKDGKPTKVTDIELKDALSKAKLRWKNILNEANDRILVMGGNRPDNIEATYELDEIVQLKSAILTAVVNSTDEDALADDPSKMLFIPSIYLNSMFNLSMKEPEEESQEHHQRLLNILSDMIDKQRNMFPITASTWSQDAAEVSKLAIEIGININGSKLPKNAQEYHWSATTFNHKIAGIDYCTRNVRNENYKYLRIKWKEMITVKVPSISEPIFFMPLGSNNNQGMLIFKKPKDITFNSALDLFDSCKMITKQMKEIEKKTQELYIPSFWKKLFYQQSNYLRGLSIGEGKYFGESEISQEFSISGALPTKFALSFEPSSESLVFNDDFVVVVTHPDLEQELNIPFMCGIITQDDWLKAN